MLKQGAVPPTNAHIQHNGEISTPNTTGDYFAGTERPEPPNETFPDRATMRLRKDIEAVTLAAELQTAHRTMNAPTHY